MIFPPPLLAVAGAWIISASLVSPRYVRGSQLPACASSVSAGEAVLALGVCCSTASLQSSAFGASELALGLGQGCQVGHRPAGTDTSSL